jgi:transposase InsO family protein
MDSRPDEPQLPLYCTSGELDIGAVAFAQLRRGKTRFNGFEAEKGILPQAKHFDTIGSLPGSPLPPSRDSVLAYWKSVLEELARQFRQGEALVNPKKPHQTCKYCELVPVCRIHEAPPADNEAGDEAGDEEGGESDAS